MMYKLENLKRDEAIADYTARKVNSDVTIVTDNADSYKGNSNIMSYKQYLNDVKNDNITEKEFFIDDLQTLLVQMGVKEAVVRSRFILR